MAQRGIAWQAGIKRDKPERASWTSSTQPCAPVILPRPSSLGKGTLSLRCRVGASELDTSTSHQSRFQPKREPNSNQNSKRPIYNFYLNPNDHGKERSTHESCKTKKTYKLSLIFFATLTPNPNRGKWTLTLSPLTMLTCSTDRSGLRATKIPF
jgi:hypothetical protein